jgi:hypothetical protein
MALQSRLLHDIERGMQGVASAVRQQNPDRFAITLEQPRQDIWRWLIASGAVKIECEESVPEPGAGERPRLAPVQSKSVAGACFLRLHHEIPGMRIGVENGFGKSGKQRIEDPAMISF